MFDVLLKKTKPEDNQSIKSSLTTVLVTIKRMDEKLKLLEGTIEDQRLTILRLRTQVKRFCTSFLFTVDITSHKFTEWLQPLKTFTAEI